MIIKVKIQPNSKENKITETLEDGTLRIKIKAPQIEGKANKELINFLSEEFKIAKSCIIIKTGASSRNKTIEILK